MCGEVAESPVALDQHKKHNASLKLAIRLDHNFGGEQLYTFRCHNLEHEDAGMMVNYRVV